MSGLELKKVIDLFRILKLENT